MERAPPRAAVPGARAHGSLESNFFPPWGMKPQIDDELGAHVSTEGGVESAPARARDIGSACLQLFTKQPNRWAEPTVDASTAEVFREARESLGIRVAGAHDSYLINLSSPD